MVASAPRTGAEIAAPPKLVIGIAIDQLRTDYLYALQARFGDDGLKKLLAGGRVYENVVFDLPAPDVVSALATLATGAYPFAHGVCARRMFDTAVLNERSTFLDPRYIGNYTTATYSPAALLSSTLGDELKSATGGAARVFAVAPEAEAALIGAGHAANCAFWLDDKTGKWATTTYYKDIPLSVDHFNREEAPDHDIELRHWTPLDGTESLPLDLFPHRHATDVSRKFDHGFLLYRQPQYSWLKTSALINEAVTDLCKILLQNGAIGGAAGVDMLQVTYYAGTYRHEREDLYYAELQDTYLRLDRAIADLLHVIDKSVGLDNTFIYLTATGDTDHLATGAEWPMGGDFNARRCTALLNSYLMSIYGPGSWVAGYADRQIYLEHKTIEDRQIRMEEIQKAAAEFVALFAGVQDVVSAYQIRHEDYSTRIAQMRNAYHKDRCGDLFITLQPGWSVRLDDNTPPKPQVRHNVAPGPAIFYCPARIQPARIAEPMEAIRIAPTVARCIRIRAPSACTTLPLDF